uniref:Uncharacterized protein n=1 Tax=Pyrodinium bahamense TaxID=73915 RepID=A0A7R9ZYP8_9DINO|mmetsp:Transcript_14771/g.40802  ORF Transcript_14771/g.40802 Transcript_14771/m.40802 type:complete len:444 (+) Transcript_14771:90-1421(+)
MRSPRLSGPRLTNGANLRLAHEADAHANPKHARIPKEGLFEYSLRLSQQVISLEAENLELQDAKTALAAQIRTLSERVEALENDNRGLRNAGLAALQERQLAERQTCDEVRAKQGEVMLLRHKSQQQLQQSEALVADRARLAGAAERLQRERRLLHREVIGWEATTSALQTEVAAQANANTEAGWAHAELGRRLQVLDSERQRANELAAERHVVDAQLQLARGEFMTERSSSVRLRDELATALRAEAGARDEAACMVAQRDMLSSEVAIWRHAEGTAAASHPALREALQRESATASSLRGRIAELEGVIASLRRGLTRMGAENGGLRMELVAARAEADRRVAASSQLAADRCGVERLAESRERGRQLAEHQASLLASEGSRLRRQGEALRGDNAKLWAEVRRLEAENIVLLSHARSVGVLAGSPCNGRPLGGRTPPLPPAPPA